MKANQIENLVGSSSDSRGGAAAAERGAAAPAVAPLPCLNTNNCNRGKEEGLHRVSSGHHKTAYALKLNVQLLVGKYGLEMIGFLTLTFARHIVSYKKAQKALHSLMTGVIRQRYPEYIIVMERMDSKRVHYHLLVVMARDIRTGFDFAAVKRGDYRSASDYLRKEWEFWRKTAPKYGFGRTELLPIKKTAEGVAKYVAKYIAKHIDQRLPEDKGARLVRYSKGTNRTGIRFSWLSVGACQWRAKLGTFCRMLKLTPDNYKESLKEWYGPNWVYHLGLLIESIKLPEYYPADEVREWNRAIRLVAVNERERRCHKGKTGEASGKLRVPEAVNQSLGVSAWASWIERTLKED